MGDDIIYPGDMLLAGRYEVIEFVGSGSYGEVWRGRHTVSGQSVAIKMFLNSDPITGRWREASALRELDSPYVVSLFDEGVIEGRPLLITEFVEGVPFPGEDVPLPWRRVRELLEHLLEALSDIHTRSIIHGDLKPSNVFVRGEHVVLLDFGLATRIYSTELLEELGQGSGSLIAGSPNFMAPELFRYQPASASTDLYAAGVMAFHALTGHLPHVANTIAQLMRLRLMEPAPSIAALRPELPEHLARLIDTMLDRQAHLRPASAHEALQLLRQTQLDAAPLVALPWLGDTAPIRALAEAARQGVPTDVRGLPGSGRRRALVEATALITAEDPWRRVYTTAPSARPLGSLMAAIGEQLTRATSFLDTQAQARALIHAQLAEGHIWLVPDWQQLDPWSARLLDEARGLKGMLLGGHATRGDITLAPIDLDRFGEALLWGPRHVFNLRERAVNLLRERTGGHPGLLVEELESWFRRNLASWDHDRIMISPAAMDTLEQFTPMGDMRGRDQTLPEALDQLMAFMALFDSRQTPGVRKAVLMGLSGLDTWTAEAHIEELIATGWLRCDGEDEHLHTLIQPPPLSERSVEWLQETRRRFLALTYPGEPGRLHHILVAGTCEQIAEEITICIDALPPTRSEQTLRYYMQGVRALQRHDRIERPEAPALLLRLLRPWLLKAPLTLNPNEMEAALDAARLCPPLPEDLTPIIELVDLCRLMQRSHTSEEERLVYAIPPFDDPDAELIRLIFRYGIAQTPQRSHDARDEMAAWATRAHDQRSPEQRAYVQALLDLWDAQIKFVTGDFERSATVARDVAERATAIRYAARNATIVAMENSLRYDEALALVEQFLSDESAGPQRRAALEVTRRRLLHRADHMDALNTADGEDLLRAITLIGHRGQARMMAVVELVIAWRLGDVEAIRRLLDRFQMDISEMEVRIYGALLAAILLARTLLNTEQPISEREREVLMGHAHYCKGSHAPKLALQYLGILARVDTLDEDELALLQQLSRDIPAHELDLRLELISPREALLWAGLD